MRLLLLGTKPSYSEIENRCISVSNVAYLSLPVVYIIFMMLDIMAYFNSGGLAWDQLIVPIFIVLCLLFLFLNAKHFTLQSRILFLIAWPLALHIIPIVFQNTPSDYYIAFPIGLIFHAVLIQTFFSRRTHPILFYIFLLANLLLMLYFSEFLISNDKNATESNIPFLGSKYYKLDGILYWLLFNFLTFYLQEALDYRDIQIKKRQDQIYVKNDLAGISFWEFKNPMPLSLPKKEQIEWTKNDAILKECNDRYAKYYGYSSSSEVVGKPYYSIHKNDELFDAAIQRAIDKDWTFFIETEETKIDGERIWFLNWLVPSIEGDQLKGLHVTQIDISKQKEAENSNSKMLEDLKEYAFLTSHKLRAPLANILGLSTILESEEDEKISNEVLKMLKTSSEVMDSVIKEMNEILSRNQYDKIVNKE